MIGQVRASERLIVALDVPTPEDATELIAKIGGNAGVWKIGLELLFAGGAELARELVDQGLELAGDNVAVTIGAGEFNYYTHEYDEAERHFERARTAAPEAWEPVRGLLRVYERKGHFAESLELTRELHGEFPVEEVLPWHFA